MELPRSLILQLFDLYRINGTDRLGLILATEGKPVGLGLPDARSPDPWADLLEGASARKQSVFACFCLGPQPVKGTSLPSTLANLPLIEVNEEFKGVLMLRVRAEGPLQGQTALSLIEG